MDQDRSAGAPRAPGASPPLVSAPDRGPLGGWGLLGAGVVGACALGVVAGVWARSDRGETVARRADAKAALGVEVPRRIRILMDDASPQPVSDPPTVRIGAAPVPVTLSRQAPAQAQAPVVAAPAPAIIPVRTPPAPARPAPKVAPVKTRPVKTRPAEPPPAKLVKAKAVEAKPSRAKPSRAAAPAAKLLKAAAKARSKETPATKGTGPVKAAPPPTVGRGILIKVPAKLAPKPRPVLMTAKAPAPRPAAPKLQLAVARAAPARATPLALWRAPASTLDMQLAALRAEPLKPKAPAPPPPASASKSAVAEAPRPPARTQPACAAESRADALVCADPRLAAADRRLARAYRQAEAAGVEPGRLQRQQARWRAAREAAAEQAPGAVAQVYDARIAELEDEADRARNDGEP
jgi:uncharacterized protein YecT (DUF1311 family)